MKALSLWQPYASLVLPDYKIHETRPWSTSYRGPLAIHAAKRWDAEIRDLCLNDPFCRYLEELKLLHITPDSFEFQLPLGAVVATADLVDCYPTSTCRWVSPGIMAISPEFVEPGTHLISMTDALLGNYSEGRFAFQFANIRPLTTPVPYRGSQRFFEVPDDLLREAQQ